MTWKDNELMDDLEMFLDKKKKRRHRRIHEIGILDVRIEDEYERIDDDAHIEEECDDITRPTDECVVDESIVDDSIMDERAIDGLIRDRKRAEKIPDTSNDHEMMNGYTHSIKNKRPFLETPPLPDIIIQLANVTDEGIIIVQDAKIRFANQRMECITGFSGSELVDSLIRNYVIPDHIPLISDLRMRSLGSNDVLEQEIGFWKKDGSKIQVEVKAGKITFFGRTAVLMMIRDRTMDREREQDIRFGAQALEELASNLSRSLAINVDEYLNLNDNANNDINVNLDESAKMELQVTTDDFVNMDVNVKSNKNEIIDSEADSYLSKKIEGSDIDNTRRFLENALMTCSKLIGAGKGQIMEFSENGRKMDCTYEWCSSSTASELKLLKELDTTGYPWILKRLGAGKTIRIRTISELPPDASSERATFESRGIRSMLIMPLFTKSKLCGYAEFDYMVQKEDWRDQELHFATACCSTISCHLERIWNSRKQQVMASQITSIMDSIPMMIVIVDDDTKVRGCNQAYAVSHGMEKIDIMDKYFWEPFDSGNYEGISDHVESAMDGSSVHKEIPIYMNGVKMMLESRFIPQSSGGVLIIMQDKAREKASVSNSMIMMQGFQSMIEMLEEPTMMVDGAGDVIAINQATIKHFGASGEGLVGLLVFESTMREGTGGDSALETIINSGKPFVVTEEGTGVTYEITVRPIFGESGKVAYLIIHANEVGPQ